MKEIRMSSQFKKDFKRYRNNIEKVKALYHIIGYLERGEQIPSQFKPRVLKGELKGVSITVNTDEPESKPKSTPICKKLNSINFSKEILSLRINNYARSELKIELFAHTASKKTIRIGDMAFPVRAIPKNKQTKNSIIQKNKFNDE